VYDCVYMCVYLSLIEKRRGQFKVRKDFLVNVLFHFIKHKYGKDMG
jgi:hypothetical protein